MKFQCEYCGRKNGEEREMCRSCGANLPEIPPVRSYNSFWGSIVTPDPNHYNRLVEINSDLTYAGLPDRSIS
jgi:hypothetical protein